MFIIPDSQATAVVIGLGSSAWESPPTAFFDWHAGISETSLMLHLRPDLVRMDRLKNPKIMFTPQMDLLRQHMEAAPSLYPAWDALFTAPPETGKGGASHELSDNGIWCLDDVRQASAEKGKVKAQRIVDAAVRLIRAWKMAEPVKTEE